MKEIQTKDIKEGDLKAYYRLFELYHEKLYTYIYRYTGSQYYAEEVTQLSFIKLWEKRTGLSEEYSLSTQLFRIAGSLLIDLLRKERIRDTRELSDTFISAECPEENYLHKEELSRALSAIEELPPQCRQVFKMSRFESLTHNEISAELSISPKTIETHITKAIKYIRKSLSVFF